MIDLIISGIRKIRVTNSNFFTCDQVIVNQREKVFLETITIKGTWFSLFKL